MGDFRGCLLQTAMKSCAPKSQPVPASSASGPAASPCRQDLGRSLDPIQDPIPVCPNRASPNTGHGWPRGFPQIAIYWGGTQVGQHRKCQNRGFELVKLDWAVGSLNPSFVKVYMLLLHCYRPEPESQCPSNSQILDFKKITNPNISQFRYVVWYEWDGTGANGKRVNTYHNITKNQSSCRCRNFGG